MTTAPDQNFYYAPQMAKFAASRTRECGVVWAMPILTVLFLTVLFLTLITFSIPQTSDASDSSRAAIETRALASLTVSQN